MTVEQAEQALCEAVGRLDDSDGYGFLGHMHEVVNAARDLRDAILENAKD